MSAVTGAGTPLADGAPAGPHGGPQPEATSPLDAAVRSLIDRLETLAKAPDAKLTCDDLIATIGAKSHALTVLIFSLLNLLPAPPGFNFMVGLLIIGLAILMTFDRPVHLWALVGHRRLPLKLLIKLLSILSSLSAQVGRISRPRFLVLTDRRAQPLIGVFNVLLGLTLLIPIPFTNMVPSMALVLISLGLINRDGILLLAGMITGIAGALIALIATWFVIALFIAVEHEIEEVFYPDE